MSAEENRPDPDERNEDESEDASAGASNAVETGDEETEDTIEERAEDEPAAEPSESEPIADEPPRRRGGGFVAFLALLVALVAAAGTGWLWIEVNDRASAAAEPDDRLPELQAQLAAAEARISSLAEQLDATSEESGSRERRLERLGRAMDQQSDIAAASAARISRLENAVTALPAATGDSDREWQLNAAEHYMQVANTELLLAGRIDAAALALTLADERLRDIADPTLSPVRAALSDEIASLEAAPLPDIEGVALKLASLARVLPGLPMRSRPPSGVRGDGAPPESLTGFARAIEMLKTALSRLISVKRTDAPVAPLLSDEERRVMVSAITLDLRLASLAAMRGYTDVYSETLGAVRSRFDAYFDGTSPEVMAAKFALSELQDERLETDLPEISGSLALLRQQRALDATDP